MTISPELAAVAHAAANLATARIKSDRLRKESRAAYDEHNSAEMESARAWSEYESACSAFVASLAG